MSREEILLLVITNIHITQWFFMGISPQRRIGCIQTFQVLLHLQHSHQHHGEMVTLKCSSYRAMK